MLICCTIPYKSSLHHRTLKLALYTETSGKVPQFFFIKGVEAINGKAKLLRLVICECSSPELDIIKRRLIIVIFIGSLAVIPNLRYSSLRVPRMHLKVPSFSLHSSMTVFSLVLATYFLVVSSFIYNVIVEPPSFGSMQDPVTGT